MAIKEVTVTPTEDMDLDEIREAATERLLDQLARVHAQRLQLQEREARIEKALAKSSVRGVRTRMAKILGISPEALRLRHGPTPSVKPHNPRPD